MALPAAVYAAWRLPAALAIGALRMHLGRDFA